MTSTLIIIICSYAYTASCIFSTVEFSTLAGCRMAEIAISVPMKNLRDQRVVTACVETKP